MHIIFRIDVACTFAEHKKNCVLFTEIRRDLTARLQKSIYNFGFPFIGCLPEVRSWQIRAVIVSLRDIPGFTR